MSEQVCRIIKPQKRATRNARLRQRKMALLSPQNAVIRLRSRCFTNGPQARSSISPANDADQRGRRRCNAGIVSAGLYSSEEF